MKEFRKNEQGLFVCEECGLIFKICSTLSYHIGQKHNKRKYFNKWIKEEHEGKCLKCGKETEYLNRWDRGYKQFCSKKCKREFGMSNNAKELMKVSLKKTCLEKYGCEAFTQTEEFKKKAQKTWNKKYGVDNPAKNDKIKEKTYQSSLKAFSRHKYQNINCQGTYELDFLEKYFPLFPDIQRGPTIKYNYDNKQKLYFSDFYIPLLNLIVECKNRWLYKRDKLQIEEKEKATISNGFNYILIIDKKYHEFDNYLHKASAV